MKLTPEQENALIEKALQPIAPSVLKLRETIQEQVPLLQPYAFKQLMNIMFEFTTIALEQILTQCLEDLNPKDEDDALHVYDPSLPQENKSEAEQFADMLLSRNGTYMILKRFQGFGQFFPTLDDTDEAVKNAKIMALEERLEEELNREAREKAEQEDAARRVAAANPMAKLSDDILDF